MEGTRCTVLLVEDEVIIGLAEGAALAQEGYSVIHVSSGEDAIRAVSGEPGSKIDLVLMDINLGEGIDGIRAAQEILKRRDLPMIFLTSRTQKEIVDRAKKIPNYGYIAKSSGNAALFAAIETALEPSEATN